MCVCVCARARVCVCGGGGGGGGGRAAKYRIPVGKTWIWNRTGENKIVQWHRSKINGGNLRKNWGQMERTMVVTVVPIEVFLKYWFNTLPRADQFISSSSSRYSYTSCERANSKYLIISGHFLSIYDWLVAQTTKVIRAFKLFNRKFTIILGSVWIFWGTGWNELVSPR